MCEYTTTADKPSTDKPSEALDAYDALNTSLRHTRAVVDLLHAAEGYGGTPEYEDITLDEIADLLKAKLSAASIIAAELWRCYVGRADAIKTLEQQLSETAKGVSHT